MKKERYVAIPYPRMNKEAKVARRVWGERAGRTAFAKRTPRSGNPFIPLKRIPEMHDYWFVGWDLAEKQEQSSISLLVQEAAVDEAV